MKIRSRIVAVMAAGAFFASTAANVCAKAQEDNAVAIDSMWKTFGASAYLLCLAKTYAPADPDVRESALAAAHAACREEPAKVFKATTMNGGAFPPMFIAEAKSVIPGIDAYFAQFVAGLPANGQALDSTYKVAGRLPDGTIFDPLDGANGKLPALYYQVLVKRGE